MIRLHLNLNEAANPQMGIAQYERHISEELWRLGEFEFDAIAHRRTVKGMPFPVRSGFFPTRYFFGHTPWQKYCPFSYNTLVGDFRSDISLFFANIIPNLPIRGKSICVIHDLIPIRIPDLVLHNCPWFSPESLKAYCKQHEYAVTHADKIVTVSNFSRHDIAEEFGLKEDSIGVATSGVDAARFEALREGDASEAEVRQKYSLPPHYILYFGTTALYKNVENLILGYAKTDRTFQQNYPLVITHKNEELEAAAKKSGANVIFPPFIDERDKPSFIRMASAFAFISRYEGFGIPPVEAMASGVPVLVSTCTALPEVVGDAGLKVGPDDLDGIATSLERLVTDNALRERLIPLGHQQARKYTWAKSAKNLAEIIKGM